MQMEYHNPVLLSETVEGLNIKEDGVYVDVTFGGGGHSRKILESLGSKGRLIAFDQDKDALFDVIIGFICVACFISCTNFVFRSLIS